MHAYGYASWKPQLCLCWNEYLYVFLDTLDRDELIKLVGRKLRSKWYKIGQQLGIAADALSEMSASTEPWDTYSRLEKVLKAWEANPPADRPYTWETIISVLKSEIIHEHDVAAEVKKYCLKGFKEPTGKY